MVYVQNRVRELMTRKARKENRRITIDIVADETGISRSSVQNWSSNKINVFYGEAMAAFLLYFDCEFNELFELIQEEGDETPEMESSLIQVA